MNNFNNTENNSIQNKLLTHLVWEDDETAVTAVVSCGRSDVPQVLITAWNHMKQFP